MILHCLIFETLPSEVCFCENLPGVGTSVFLSRACPEATNGSKEVRCSLVPRVLACGLDGSMAFCYFFIQFLTHFHVSFYLLRGFLLALFWHFCVPFISSFLCAKASAAAYYTLVFLLPLHCGPLQAAAYGLMSQLRPRPILRHIQKLQNQFWTSLMTVKGFPNSRGWAK